MDLTLQALVDPQRVPPAEVDGWLAAAARGGVTGVQLRVKDGSTRDAYAYGQAVAAAARAAGVWFSVNDRLDLALALGADCVHLGADDLPPAAARRLAPGLALGLTARTLDELDWALGYDPTYVGFGPVWATPSKADAATPVGPAALAAAVRRSARPIVAIGGVDAATAPAAWAAGAAGLAVISALTEAPDVEAAARALLPSSSDTDERGTA